MFVGDKCTGGHEVWKGEKEIQRAGTEFFKRVVRIGVTVKVTAKQRLGGSKRPSHAEIGWKRVSVREHPVQRA